MRLGLIKEEFKDMPVDWNPYEILEVRRDASDSEIKKCEFAA